MTRYFAIIGVMRTGSNLLERTLSALGDTICYGEPFNPAFVGGPRKADLLGWDVTRRNAKPMQFLGTLITAEPRLIPGFRIFDRHTPEVLDHILTDPNCARILLRRDPLESFVSLKIARATDQWILRNPKKRQQARIRFDAEEFAEYAERLDAHYDHCQAKMVEAGLDALHVDYADLADHTVLQRIAEHIGSCGTPPKDAPLIRQNPGHLSTKVDNYEEMCTILGLEPLLPPKAPLATLADLWLPDGVPFGFAPISGPTVLPMLALMQRIEARKAGRRHVSRGALIDGMRDGTLFAHGTERALPCQLITMVCHPVDRAVALFMETVFAPTWRGSSLRYDIVNTCPELADLEDQHIPNAANLVPAFSVFLDALAETPYRPGDAARHASQASVLRAYRSNGLDPQVVRIDGFAPLATGLAANAGIDPIPPGQVASMSTFSEAPAIATDALVQPCHLQAIAGLWSEDFDEFGYQVDGSAQLDQHAG